MADQSGFLTQADRAFLEEDKTYETKQGRYARRESIRERTRAALHDFTLVYTALEREELETIFEPLADGLYHPNARPEFEATPPEEYRAARDFRDGLFSTLAVIYLGLRENPVSFIELVEAAVFQSERETFDQLVDVDLTIERKKPANAVENAIAKLEAGDVDTLTATETRLLLDVILNPDTYQSTLREETLERLDDLEAFTMPTDSSG